MSSDSDVGEPLPVIVEMSPPNSARATAPRDRDRGTGMPAPAPRPMPDTPPPIRPRTPVVIRALPREAGNRTREGVVRITLPPLPADPDYPSPSDVLQTLRSDAERLVGAYGGGGDGDGDDAALLSEILATDPMPIGALPPTATTLGSAAHIVYILIDRVKMLKRAIDLQTLITERTQSRIDAVLARETHGDDSNILLNALLTDMESLEQQSGELGAYLDRLVRTIARDAASLAQAVSDFSNPVSTRLSEEEFAAAVRPVGGADLDRRHDGACPNCPICQEPVGEGDAQLSCGHIGHRECLRLWFVEKCVRRVCPICRAEPRPHAADDSQSQEGAEVGEEEAEEQDF